MAQGKRILKVLIEVSIEMDADDTKDDWIDALKEDFFPGLPGTPILLRAIEVQEKEQSDGR